MHIDSHRERRGGSEKERVRKRAGIEQWSVVGRIMKCNQVHVSGLFSDRGRHKKRRS